MLGRWALPCGETSLAGSCVCEQSSWSKVWLWRWACGWGEGAPKGTPKEPLQSSVRTSSHPEQEQPWSKWGTDLAQSLGLCWSISPSVGLTFSVLTHFPGETFCPNSFSQTMELGLCFPIFSLRTESCQGAGPEWAQCRWELPGNCSCSRISACPQQTPSPLEST